MLSNRRKTPVQRLQQTARNHQGKAKGDQAVQSLIENREKQTQRLRAILDEKGEEHHVDYSSI